MSQEQIFASFCRTHFDQAIRSYQNSEKYQSLPICIIDCVYSLRAQYHSTTVLVVKRYADRYLNGDRYSKEDSLSQLMERMMPFETISQFSTSVLQNQQKLSGRNKAEVCYDIARKLSHLLNIETLEDFRNFPKEELLEIVLRSVKGVGDAALNYLFMLAGDPHRCKPDVHIHQCLTDALGHDVSNEDCQRIFTAAVAILKDAYPTLTVRDLDYVVWSIYQAKRP